jgi:uncharacterized protein (UPF0332 family)
MEDAVKRMIISQMQKAADKLSAAKLLLEEDFLDDAISRAYYCMYHSASAVLLAEGLTAKTHDALKMIFGLYLVKTGKIDRKYGRLLSNLKDERESGDYDLFSDFQREDTESAVKQAEDFLSEMKRYLRKNFEFEI